MLTQAVGYKVTTLSKLLLRWIEPQSQGAEAIGKEAEIDE